MRLAKAWVEAEPVPATEVRAEVRAVIHATMHEVMHEVMREVMRARSEGVPHLLPLLSIPSPAARVRSPLLLPNASASSSPHDAVRSERTRCAL